MTQPRDPQTATVTTEQPPAQGAAERPKLQISATAITAGVVASTASALLGSGLGVAGTLLGAALGALVYALASALYTHWVAATKYRVQELRIRSDRGGRSADGAPSAMEPVDVAAHGDSAPDSQPAVRPELRHQRAVRSNWRAVLAGSLGSAFAFALALLLVTGIESAKGAPLSGGAAGGLTVLGGSSYGQPDPGQPDAGAEPSTSSAVTHTRIETSTQTARETETATRTATETATETATQTETAVVTATQSAQPTTAATGADGLATAVPPANQPAQTTAVTSESAAPTADAGVVGGSSVAGAP